LTSETTAAVDINAPYAEFNAAVIEPFEALRERSGQLLGWDALSNLENAIVPIEEPLAPGRQQDWLYTGRAFELHSGLVNEGWMVAIPEEISGQTYWRVYLRSVVDDGLARPLLQYPWDFNTGAYASQIPDGSWVDFTAAAVDYGFQRLPSLPNWRMYYPGMLFNQFALTAGLSWNEAMLQLYSQSVVATVAAGSVE
jgi:hypothetical protein